MIKIKKAKFLIFFFAVFFVPKFAYCLDSTDACEESSVLPTKYQKAIEEASDHNYEKAIKLCGADKYRLYAPTMWGKHFSGFFTMVFDLKNNYNSLIAAELHHIAGDMMHIANMEKDKNYQAKVNSALVYKFNEKWLKKNARGYSTTDLLGVKIPSLSDQYSDSEENRCEAFIKMIDYFKRWEELRKGATNSGLMNFFCEIIEYSSHKALLKYREQRRLSLFGHPKYFSIYNTSAYEKARAKEQKSAIAAINYDTYLDRKEQKKFTPSKDNNTIGTI